MFMTYSRECSLNVGSSVTGFTVCVISFFLFFFSGYLSVGIVLWLVLFVPVLFFKHIKPVLPKNAWEWCLERAESVM